MKKEIRKQCAFLSAIMTLMPASLTKHVASSLMQPVVFSLINGIFGKTKEGEFHSS